MFNSISYILCNNLSCDEVGNIKKNLNKCPKCKKHLIPLNLANLNKYYCTSGIQCNDTNCKFIHPKKYHISPSYISPCYIGKYCKDKNCLFLHPNKNDIWLVKS